VIPPKDQLQSPRSSNWVKAQKNAWSLRAWTGVEVHADYGGIIFKDCMSRKRFINGSEIVALSASPKTVFRLPYSKRTTKLFNILAGPNLFQGHCLEAAQTLYF
jgi:hypothetical protein